MSSLCVPFTFIDGSYCMENPPAKAPYSGEGRGGDGASLHNPGIPLHSIHSDSTFGLTNVGMLALISNDSKLPSTVPNSLPQKGSPQVQTVKGTTSTHESVSSYYLPPSLPYADTPTEEGHNSSVMLVKASETSGDVDEMMRADQRIQPSQQPISQSHGLPSDIWQNGYITVVDPGRLKLNVPLSAIRVTKAIQRRSKAPSLCLLYEAGRCNQGTNCNQVHAVLDVIQHLRLLADSMPCCCAVHGDVNHTKWDVQRHSHRCITIGGKIRISFSSMAYTLGLKRLLQNNQDEVRVKYTTLCHNHGSETSCRYGSECRYLHICRKVHRDVIESFQTDEPDGVQQPNISNNSSAVGITTHKWADAQGTDKLSKNLESGLGCSRQDVSTGTGKLQHVNDATVNVQRTPDMSHSSWLPQSRPSPSELWRKSDDTSHLSSTGSVAPVVPPQAFLFSAISLADMGSDNSSGSHPGYVFYQTIPPSQQLCPTSPYVMNHGNVGDAITILPMNVYMP